MQKTYRTIKSILDPFRYNSLEDKDPPVNFSSIDKEMIYHATESVMDPFKYKSLEDKDAPTNFSLIDTVKNSDRVRSLLIACPFASEFVPSILDTCANYV